MVFFFAQFLLILNLSFFILFFFATNPPPPPPPQIGSNTIERRRWYETIVSKCMPGSTRVFGVPLETVVSREKQSIPSIVRACAEYLRQGDRLNTIGLFRKQGYHALLEFARDLFDAGDDVDLSQVPRVDEVV